MNNNQQQRVTPRDVARILFRHWRKMATFAVLSLGLTLALICLYPRSYSSEARLMIRIGRETVGLDPTATTGETVMLQKTQDDEVNSAMNILASREVLEGVVKQIGPQRILLERLESASTNGAASDANAIGNWTNEILQTVGLSDPGTEMDRAVRRLESKLAIGAQKQSTVITISYTAASPELAHDVVDAVTKVFLLEHSRINQQDGSLAFFAEQADKLRDELTTAQLQLRDQKNAYQMTSGTGRQSLPEKAKEALLQKLYDLQLQEGKLRSIYTAEYPLLREVQRERQEAEELLANISGTKLPITVKATNQGDGQGSTNADPASAKLATDVQLLNDQEFELAQLEREVSLLEGKYKMHVAKLEQARLNDALGREQITNVKVAQPASLVRKPVAPKKVIILGAGLVMALFGSLGLALVCETLDQTLRTPDQIEFALGLPVLASLPHRKGNKLQLPLITKLLSRFERSEDGKPAKHRRPNYRGLLTALQNGNATDGQAKTLGVVGCESFKLRSWIAGDIAIHAAAASADRVLLIDADAKRRRVAKRFDLNGEPGWSELLNGDAAAENCVKWSQSEKLAVMGPGHAVENSRAQETAFSTLGEVDGIRSEYGLVVVDLPSANDEDGPQLATEWIDEVVLVVEAERTRIQAAQRAKSMLDRAGVRLAGVVLANRREHIPEWLYQRL